MTLQHLTQSLRRLERDPRWSNYRALQVLQQVWSEALGEVVAQHTAPFQIQRGILKVATSTGAWAQNLGFQRLLILSKLNPHLSTPLTDIRFLPGEWHRRALERVDLSSNLAYLSGQSRPAHAPTRPQSPQEALDLWHQRVLTHQRQMPRCPQCHQAATEQELARWNLCGYCWINHIARPPGSRS
ncbi:MAG: DUF721 domain-containing protein [Synechococcaceae cyanobacterium SM2_3_2]|nr:DUF721 domain-containing protein [Synechococcaceae cyanobacterium SM2_3_2]